MEKGKKVYTVEARGVTEGVTQVVGVYSNKNSAFVTMKALSKQSELQFRMIEWDCIDYGLLPGRLFQDVSTILKNWDTPL